MSKLAKALYDNTAECPDELAFRRGDILAVIDQSVAGTSGWWMCSLHGHCGLAPANRLQLLPMAGAPAAARSQPMQAPALADATPDDAVQNIYQIPSVPRLSSSPAYERMDMICRTPPDSSAPERNKASFFSPTSSKLEVYDVPVQARLMPPLTASTTPRPMTRKYSLNPTVELEKRLDSLESLRGSSPTDCYVYAVPPSLNQDPNYDIPVPSEIQQKRLSGCKTLPTPHKSEWIYDVPIGPEKHSPPQGSCDTMSSTPASSQFYGTCAWSVATSSPAFSVYDIPKQSSVDCGRTPQELPRVSMYDKPPKKTAEESIYDVPPQEEPPTDHIPLECRVDPGNELKRVRLQRMRNFLAVTTFHNLPGTGKSLVQEDDERGRTLRITAAESQRISTASSSSSSSTSSCDSLALSSSSPEPLREVTLSQEEACRRLVDLQESVNRAVPRLMNYVSSHWRRREHLEKHLKDIKDAAGGIAASLTGFLNFALDIKGNAYRLTDANLQTRLYKQLSIIEDSGVILQQTLGALAGAGWPIDTLCQNPKQVQSTDQLDRFVMVARTVPEDIKRLVSIINANGKLLFRTPQKDPEPPNTRKPDMKRGPYSSKQGGSRSEEDDSDYVELQIETEKQQRATNQTPKPVSNKAQVDNRRHSSEPTNHTKDQSPMSEHCRLYFGALQKAIGGFVGSLQDGQPPEKFISQSKLVIMVGQRLVDTLCREAQREGSNHSLLSKSNHLCALLKQLAVATKKAALHFPDVQALHEAQEFAKELAQRSQHFRTSLDL